MATEEFKIKTEVELDTKEAEAKLKSFVNGQNKPLEVDLKLKNLNSALNKDLKSLNTKINNQLEIKPESLKGFEQLDNALKNIQTRLKGMKNLLNNGQINIFNIDGANPKLFDDNLKSIENYVKKVEKGYQKIKEAKDKVDSKPKNNIIDLDKAENDAKKFANRIDALKLQFNNLKLNAIGIDNLDSINNQLDNLKAKARESALNGLGVNTPEIDRENKVLQEKYKLLQKIQSEYKSFEKFKLDFGESIDKDSLQEVENLFRNITQKITSMDDLELDFNLDSFRTFLDNIKTSLKKDLKLDIDLSKTEESYLKFFNNLEVLKFELQKLKGLDIDIIGEDNFKKIENRIDQLRNKAGDNLLKGKSLKDSDVDLGYKNLKEQEKLLKRVQSEYSKFQNKKGILEDLIGIESISKIENEFKKAFSKISSMENLELDFDLNKLFKRLKDVDNAYNIQIETDKAENQIDKFQNKLKELEYRFNNLDIDIIGEDNLNKILNQIKNIKNESQDILYGTSGKKISDFDLDVKNLKEQFRLLQKIQSRYEKFNNNKINLNTEIDTNQIKEIEDVFKNIIQRISSMKNLELDFNLDGFLHSANKVNSSIKQIDNNFLGVKKIASDFKSEIASYTIGESLGDTVTDFARGIGQSYIELDRSMKEIKKVANFNDIDTSAKLNEIRKQAIGIAKDVGMASSDVQHSIASALQSGMGGMKESIEVAKQSMVLANVGDMTQESASKAVNTVVKSFQLSPLKSYQLEVSGVTKKTTELKNAMDLMNYAGNNYAIGTDGIAEAMKRGGAVLASYNVSLEDSVGLITATNEALQNPERVGNGLKTIAINLAGMKTSAKDGTIGLNKTAMALKEIADVDVYKNQETGELKNMVEILDEVQAKWGKLSDAQQKALSESISGKQQATVFQSLMQNYKAFDKIREEFASGQHFGSAEKENEKYVNSLDGKLNKLKETWTSTFTTLVNSDVAYGVLDGLIAISEAINKIVVSLSEMDALLPSIVMLFTSLKSFTNEDSPLANKLKESVESFKKFKNDNNSDENSNSDNNDSNTDKKISKFKKLKESMSAFKESFEGGNGIVGGIKSAISAFKQMGDEAENSSNRTGKLKNIFSGLKDSAKDLAFSLIDGGIASLVTVGVEFAFEKINDKMHELENTKKALYDNIDGLKNENSSLKQNSSWLKSNKDRYNELITKKKEYSNLPTLNKSQENEMKELKNLQSQIAEMNPDLVLGYSSDGSPILAMAGDMDKLIQKTEKAIEKNNELINGNKREIGKIASEEIRYGEYGGTSLMRQLKNESEAYQLALKQQNKYFNDKNSSALDSIGAFNGKKYAKALREREEETQKHYDTLLETTQSYLEKEREVQAGMFTKIEGKSSFKNLNDDAKAEMMQVMDMVNWGKFNSKDQRVWINGFDKMGESFGKNKGAIQSYREEWEKLNEEYAMTGDYDKYSKSMDKIAKGMAEIMGVSDSNVGSIKKGLMQVVEPLEPAERKLNDFLKSYNKTLADVEAGDSVANKLANQFKAINNAMEIFADESSYKQNGALTFQAVVDIANLENLPSKIKQFANKVKADGVTKLESEMIITQVEIARSGGLKNTSAKNEIEDLLTNPNKPITKDVQINPDFTLTKERLEGIREWNKLNPNDKITADDLFDLDGIAKASRQITDNIFKDMYKGNKDGKLKVAIEGLGLDTEGKANNLKKALDSIPEEKRVEFVENFGDAFSKTEDFKEAIKSLPKEVRLNYGIGIEGDKELSSLKTTLDNLKQRGVISANFEVDANGIDKLMMYQSLLDNFEDEKVYKIPFDIVMKSGNIQDLVNELKSKFNLTEQEVEARFGIKVDGVEKAQSDLNTLQETANNLEKNGATVKINGEQVNASLEDVKAWAELSKEVSEGNYEMKMNLQVEDAIKNATDLESRLSKINGKEYKASFMVKTAEAYNKLKALIIKIQQVQKLSGQKMTSTVSVNTAQARKNMTGLINKIHNLRDAMSELKSVNININTAQARKNISGLLIRINQMQEKSGNKSILFTAKTQTARKNISGLIKRASQYKGKTYHASFIAHTSKAYSKISALISKCKAYGGKTYHASFIAHTSHAYSKVSALLSKAQSYSGRTFHASMTVTTNKVEKIISKPSGKPEAPANLTRTITTTYANDGIMPIDEPTTIDESMSRAKGSSSSTSIPFKDFMAGQMNDAKMSFKDWVNFINKLITDSITNVTNKTESLAEAVKKGATVVLTPIASTVKDILDALKFDVNRLQELENSIKRIAYNIDLLDKRIDRSVGSARIENLKKQNIELKKRIKLNEQLIKQKKKEKEILKQELKKKGLKFTKDDNISNYEETILKLKREMEKLDKASDKLSDKESKRNEKRKKEIEEIIKMMEKFIQLVFTDIPELDLGIMDDKAQIEDNELEIKQIEYEKWVVGLESSFKNVNKELQKLTNQLEMLEVQMEHAWGKEKLDLMNKQIDLIKKSQSALKDNITVMKSAQESAKNKLMEYGFKFNSNGDIENFVEQMNHLKDTSKEFDTIQGLVDGYFDLYLEQIPEAERELAGFTNKIKDIYKEQLNATKELEDKIIDMYKKQLEERKKLIDEELKKRLDALKKEQDAYKRAREEQNYKDDFNEQADKVKEIQKQIDLARKDTSLTGQKKLKDLLKQLEEEKKKLDDITQDRIDQQVDDAFKDEEDRLQQGAEDEKDRLDKEFSDEELLKKAQEAIKNGLFIGIDGEVKNLQSALLEYIDKWEEGLSATGAIIKSEWITNLEIANSLIKDYAGVLDSIGVGSLNTNEIYNKIPNIKPESNSKTDTKSINYNQPLVVVQGNVDNNNIEQIKRVVQESIDRNNREILRKI